jgi:hypothetical protein
MYSSNDIRLLVLYISLRTVYHNTSIRLKKILKSNLNWKAVYLVFVQKFHKVMLLELWFQYYCL